MHSLKKLALIGLATATILGCDAGKSPDAEARAKMNEGRIAALSGESGRDNAISTLKDAAGTDGTSPASVAQAQAILGQVQFDAGLEKLREADRKELTASKIALQIAALGSQLGNSATLVQGYQKLDPKPAQVAIEQKIAEAKGGPDKPKWISDPGINVSSLSAAEQEVSRVQGEIAKRQSEIDELGKQRVAALEDSEKAMKASEAAKGRESVDAYKQYSDNKKKASDLQTRIDQLKGEIVPLENDLKTAQGQQQVLQGAIATFDAQSKALDEGWKDIQTKIAAKTDLIQRIASATDAPSTQPTETANAAGKSIAGKATILAKTVKEAEDARTIASEKIGEAIKAFNDAGTAASTAQTEMSELADKRPALVSVVKVAKEVLAPQIYKLRLATAERMLAEMSLSKASGISARMKLRDMVTPLLQQAQQPVPKELADTTLEAQLKEAISLASASFDDAKNHLDDVIGNAANDSISKSTQKAAAISTIFLLYGKEQLATLQGDKAAAEKNHTDAIAAVKSAAELQVSFPTLPGDLASAIPPPPPPPTPATEPTAPAEGTAAAEASPEEAAARAVLATFLDALQKGDVDGAKAVSQIEPGAEDFFNSFTGVIVEGTKFMAALKEKFGEEVSKAGGMPDIAAAVRNAKITVNGEEAMMADRPGMPPKKRFAKVDGAWKMFFGAPDDDDKKQMEMSAKLTPVFATLTTDIQADKYPTLQDVNKAVGEAIMPVMMQGMTNSPAPTPAPAPQ